MSSAEEVLTSWVEEALDLRHGSGEDNAGKVSLPPFELGQPAALDMLQRIRVRLDRVEELQSHARVAKGRAIRARESADFEASIAYDQALQHNRATKIQEYVSAAEKRADASLASLEQKRLAHQLQRQESFAAEALDVITQCYWGLEKLREDVLQMLRLHSFVTAEEVQT